MVRNSNILVGVHGAGLMFVMFAAEEVHDLSFQIPVQEFKPLVVT